MKKHFIFILCILTVQLAFSQSERGRMVKNPKFNKKVDQETKNEMAKEKKEKQKNDLDSEFQFSEAPAIKFLEDYDGKSTQLPTKAFEPLKELNNTVAEDTSTSDEFLSEVDFTNIEETATFEGSDKQVTVAKYFQIWDTHHVNPYGLDGRDFAEVIPIKLYDKTINELWSAPLNKSPITSSFKFRKGRWHTGVDLDLETGDPVYSTFSGRVRVSGWQGAYGNCVVVRHDNGLETLYGHMSKIFVEPNTLVRFGDQVGLGGSTGRSTGSHLHFETMYEGNRFDPEEIFDFGSNSVKMETFILTPDVYNWLRGGRKRAAEEYTSIEELTDTPALELDEDEDKPKKTEQKIRVRARSGDNLTEIAQRYKTTPAQIARLNNFSAKHRLRVGEYIRVR